jgi:hypothetical protein
MTDIFQNAKSILFTIIILELTIRFSRLFIKMIQDPSSQSEDEYVRLDEDMEREGQDELEVTPKEEGFEEEEEPPLLSSVFAIDQLKQGAQTAASFFSWGFGTVKEKANALSETEQVKNLLDSTKVQREAISVNASQFWESTRPQRDEIARTAASISESVQPALEKIKVESVKAFETISSTVSDAPLNRGPSSRGDQLASGTATDED